MSEEYSKIDRLRLSSATFMCLMCCVMSCAVYLQTRANFVKFINNIILYNYGVMTCAVAYMIISSLWKIVIALIVGMARLEPLREMERPICDIVHQVAHIYGFMLWTLMFNRYCASKCARVKFNACQELVRLVWRDIVALHRIIALVCWCIECRVADLSAFTRASAESQMKLILAD